MGVVESSHRFAVGDPLPRDGAALSEETAAVGGELHADALLLEQGSRQEDLWGANYYPGRGEDLCIEYTSLINIRPAQGNPGMTLSDEHLRRRLQELTYSLIGRGESLP